MTFSWKTKSAASETLRYNTPSSCSRYHLEHPDYSGQNQGGVEGFINGPVLKFPQFTTVTAQRNVSHFHLRLQETAGVVPGV
jgi:hypothetical protein